MVPINTQPVLSGSSLSHTCFIHGQLLGARQDDLIFFLVSFLLVFGTPSQLCWLFKQVKSGRLITTFKRSSVMLEHKQ